MCWAHFPLEGGIIGGGFFATFELTIAGAKGFGFLIAGLIALSTYHVRLTLRDLGAGGTGSFAHGLRTRRVSGFRQRSFGSSATSRSWPFMRGRSRPNSCRVSSLDKVGGTGSIATDHPPKDESAWKISMRADLPTRLNFEVDSGM